MHIGLTYDLRDEYLAAGYSEEETAEFDRADTIDSLESALRELGHETDRIGNAKQLIQRLASGDRWDLVFNICEGLKGAGREAQVPAILEVFDIPGTFSDPCVMAACLDKGITKAIVSHARLLTPRYAVIFSQDELNASCSGVRRKSIRTFIFKRSATLSGTFVVSAFVRCEASSKFVSRD